MLFNEKQKKNVVKKVLRNIFKLKQNNRTHSRWSDIISRRELACSAQPNRTASDCLLAPSCSRSQCQIFCHHFISLAPFVKASLVFDSFSLSPPKFGSEIIYSDDERLLSRDVFFFPSSFIILVCVVNRLSPHHHRSSIVWTLANAKTWLFILLLKKPLIVRRPPKMDESFRVFVEEEA